MMHKKSLIFFLLFTFISYSAFGQNVKFVKKGEYEEWYEKPTFIKDIIVTGSYEALVKNKRGANFGDEQDNSIRQDFKLNFKSIVQKDVSLNLTIKNKPYFVGEDKSSSYSDSSHDSDSDLNIVIDEAYLEYQPTPATYLRFGKQYINPGDRRGLIYRGKDSAVTLNCKIGSWCMYSGAAQVGDKENDKLYWGSIFYPVYETGKKVPYAWATGKNKTRQSGTLTFEAYRMFYTEADVALAGYGGATWSSSDESTDISSYQLITGGKYIYYDANVEYWGLNMTWVAGAFKFEALYATIEGDREYHTGTQALSSVVALSDTGVKGVAALVGIEYVVSNTFKFNLTYFTATGDPSTDSNGNIWERSNSGFYEINKGTYGDANIFFQGYDNGYGEGHSVNNLTYASFEFSFRGKNNKVGFDARVYKFWRTEEVLNTAGEKVKDIGTEIDLISSWKLARNLGLEFHFNWFQMGNAYAADDSTTPVLTSTREDDNFTTILVKLKYNF